MLSQKSVADLMAAFSSPDPTPGGGSAAALAGATGAALFAMVAGLPKTRSGIPEERAALDAVRPRLLELQAELTSLIDRDAAAYDMVVAAYKRPRATDEEKAARKEAIQAAMRAAAEAPLATMAAAAEATELGVTVATNGNASAASDLAVAMQLIMYSAMQGAWFNVSANLGSISDPAVAESLLAQSKTHMERGGMAIRQMMRTAAITETYEAATERFGGHKHPQPTMQHAAHMLVVMQTPEAKRALEIWAAGTDSGIAEAASKALAMFDSNAPPRL